MCAMTTLAEDLILLAAGMKRRVGPPDTGTLPARLRFGLRGAELVSLAQAGRVAVVEGRIVVRDRTPVGDPALDWLLHTMPVVVPPLARDWVASSDYSQVEYYFKRLAGAGALRPVPYRLLLMVKVTAYELVDRNAFLDARRRLDEAVLSPGPVDAAQTALPGMVYAAGLSEICYPGSDNAQARERLRFLADPNIRAAVAAARLPRSPYQPPYPDPNLLWPQDQVLNQNAGHPAGQAAEHAAVHASAQAAGEAAVHAAVQAATDAAVGASVQAAVSAATAAAHSHHSSMSSDGGSGSSHHHSSSSGSSDSGGGGHHH